MAEKIANIAKNTSYFTLALIIQKIISFSYFTIYARYLGPNDLGLYYFAISFVTIASIFIDLGLSNITTREVARRQCQPNDFFRLVLAIKLPLALATWLVVFFLASANQTIVKQLIYLASVSMVLDSFSVAFFSYFRGFHNLKYESLSALGVPSLVMIISLIIINRGFGVGFLMIVLPITSLANFIYAALLAKLKFKMSLRPNYDWLRIKEVIILAWPFSLYSIIQRAYLYLDSILLYSFAGATAVGIYQVPFKIINALQFLPMAFTASLYPALSSYWQNNREQLKITFERSLNYSIIISLPIIAGTLALTDHILVIFKSGFSEAAWPLRIIMVALFFIFIHYPIGSLLNASDRQKINTINMGVGAAISLILNIILIPKFAAIGAAIAVLVSNFIYCFLGFLVSRKISSWRIKKVLPVFLKSLAIAILMYIGLILISPEVPLFFLVPMAAIFYFLNLLLWRAVTLADVRSIINSFRQI